MQEYFKSPRHTDGVLFIRKNCLISGDVGAFYANGVYCLINAKSLHQGFSGKVESRLAAPGIAGEVSFLI